MAQSLTNHKRAISIRVSESVLAWFQDHHPKGYQTAINMVLKQYVQQKHERSIWLAGRAQELYQKYYTQCFWHLRPDLQISPHNIQLVIDGLRKRGGRVGVQLAHELSENI